MTRANAAIEQNHIRVTDPFFGALQTLVNKEVLPYQWAALNDDIPGAEKSGCLRNLRIAAGEEQGEFTGMVFQDSDLAKWLEAAAYSLMNHPDEALERDVDDAVALLERAQQKDGYLNSFYTVKEPGNRFKNFRDCHELYCAGHLLEAAVAVYQATGKDRFLNVMRRYIDLIATVVGHGEGQKPAYPGHEELELALVKLYDVTKEERYLALAKYFIDERGARPYYFMTERGEQDDNSAFRFENNDAYGMSYFQAHLPVRQQKDAVGHAVRAVYLYTGMADVAMRTDDESLKQACRRLYRSIRNKRMYINGAIGSSYQGEAFTADLDLPNDTIYGETCASVGLIFFMKRMLEMDGDASYADTMERALYNGVLPGMALDGRSFFYVNPLEVDPVLCTLDMNKRHVKPERQKWFTCACCPPNVARLLENIGSYIYTLNSATAVPELAVNLYIGSDAAVTGKLTVHMDASLPWNGDIALRVEAKEPMLLKLKLRKPEWAKDAALTVNGKPFKTTLEKGYLCIERSWADGDSVALSLPFAPRRVYANPLVRENIGQVAVMNGPLLYCLEEKDNGKPLHLLHLPKTSAFTAIKGEGILTGMTLLQASGTRLVPTGDELYAQTPQLSRESTTLTFIPYYAWANRGLGEMRVYVAEEE